MCCRSWGSSCSPSRNPAAGRPELSEQTRKQDCERNAAQRWIPDHSDELRPYRPVLLGDDLYCCQSVCRAVLDAGADFVFVCKPNSHKRLYELLHDQFMRSTGWLKTRNRKKQVERHRFRWMNGVAVRDSDDAVEGAWIEYAIERKGKRTYTNTFFTSLEVTADNVAAIARAGRARWKIENEGFNCLARHGYNLKRNFGHGSDGLANLLATLNLFAFALHAVLDCVCDFVAAMPGQNRNPARLLRETAGLDGVLLLPALDGLVRDDAQATPAAGPAAGSGLRIPVTQRARSRTPGRRPQPTQAAVRFEGRLAAPSAGLPAPRPRLSACTPSLAGTVRTSIQAPKSLRRSQLHLPDLPK